jgi:lipopolysaccharide/colanic/teichoic acid biosynthesis glycosyltransferase
MEPEQTKRSLISVDRLIAILLLPLILPLLALLYLIVVPLQGRPFLFSGERMRGPREGFVQFKIRTMQPVDHLTEQSVMGGDLVHRVTPVGVLLRKTRLDELPQIFNVIRGDMVFIGPRPPLRKYVEDNPAYADILADGPPGITGLATVMLHKREERILSKCNNAADTDRV